MLYPWSGWVTNFSSCSSKIRTDVTSSTSGHANVRLWHIVDIGLCAACLLLTQSGHWLCTAAMVLMPISTSIKVLA